MPYGKRKPGRPKKVQTGRPLKINDTVLQKLEYAFSMGCTDKEACLFADISEGTLYSYQKENPDFIKRKELLKESVKLHARLNLANDIQNRGSIDSSKWYLERKAKDEFSLKSEASVSVSMEGLNDKETALADYMRGFLELE